MYARAFTPEWITELKPNEIFVFGSNFDRTGRCVGKSDF